MALRKQKVQGPDRRALTAATAVIRLDETSSWKTWKFGNKDWQIEAWRLYDIVPELHFLAGRCGESASQARLYVTEVSDTGEDSGETSDREIAKLAAIPLGTGARRDDNLRLAGIDLAVAGECWVVGEGAARDPESSGQPWFVVTGSAFKREGGTIKIRRPRVQGGGWLALRDGVDILIRCWRPHPNDVDQSDSFTRSAIVPLREIELLTRRENAELDSRMTGAGVWFLPEGVDFPRGEDDPEGIAGFMAYVQRAAAASMKDQSTASAMVPIMATIPDEMLEHLDKLKPITFWSELSAAIGDMRDKAIGRVAVSAEIPTETLTGIANANHWTAWLISEEGIRWIKGYLSLIADCLTRGFLHPALEARGVEDVERYAYDFDTSKLAARPNRLDDALQLRDRFLLTDEETIRAAAFDPRTMPTAQQRAEMLLLKLAEIRPEILADPAVQDALGIPRISAIGGGGTSVGSPPDDADDDADGPPNDGEAPDVDSSGELSSRLDHRIGQLTASPPTTEHVFHSAAKLLVYRALELAGGRLTTPAERRGRWSETPRHELHSRVGPITRDKAEKVLTGAWNHIHVVSADTGVSADDLHRLLHGYVMELLTRGIPHHDDLLYTALKIANQGRGLDHG
jgi:hypothetical protein